MNEHISWGCTWPLGALGCIAQVHCPGPAQRLRRADTDVK